MIKYILNSLKKQAQRNSDVNKTDLKHISIGSSDNKELFKQTHIFIKKIIPNRVIKDKNVYEITHIDNLYHLDGFEIDTENDKIFNVRLFGFHPNCDPQTNIFCIPNFKKGIYLTDDYLSLIVTNIQTYYLDTCYFNPIGPRVKCKKMPSMYIQLNK